MLGRLHHDRARRPLAGAVAAVALTGCTTAVDDRPATTPDERPLRAVAAAAAPPPAAGTVRLAFGGDVHFEGLLADDARSPRADLGPFSAQLRAADLAVVNLETAVLAPGRPGAPAAKELEDPGDRYWFRTGPGALDVLARSGVDVASVANNHGADAGPAGLRGTLDLREDSPVALIGAGTDHRDAFAPYRTTIRGLDVAVLAADASPRESAAPVWAAVPGSGPGLAAARVPQAPQLVAAVRTAAARDDVVVVYLHWGEEGATCPTGDQERLAATLADAGADVVVGAHAHRIQGSGLLGEGAGSTYIHYGLGNFAWYHGLVPETGLLQLDVTAEGVVRERWLPGRTPLEGGTAQPLTGAERAAALADTRARRDCTDLRPVPTPPRERSVAPDRPAAPARPDFRATISPMTATWRARMGASHDEGRCPVGWDDLRAVTVSYVDFAGQVRRGPLVVNRDVVEDVVSVFRTLYRARFPIARIRLVDAYGADDDASMAANSTSAYNCRRVAGTDLWSSHAYGRAIDLNPVQNPYVLRTAEGVRVLPRAGARFLDLDRSRRDLPPGVIGTDGVVVRAFARIGWEWGGDYADPDYQHVALDR
ncbi:CapA family protein [Nocardioides sp.]|uniref:CapA family protein n=1 Tax=Nocardioides sp. TaxID=35761 RepID=UPI0035188BE0